MTLAPGESFSTFDTFVAVHRGDYFATLDAYRRILAERGMAQAKVPAAAYEPIWCAWGYERDFTVEQVMGTLPKAQRARAGLGRARRRLADRGGRLVSRPAESSRAATPT